MQPEPFSGEVFRATRQSLEPLASSQSAGRWMPASVTSVLYTSFERDGALAEVVYHWAQMSPVPTKPALVSRLGVRTHQTLKLLRTTLQQLGVPDKGEEYSTPLYNRTQEIGAAVHFLGCDGLIVPSARWQCDNLVLFTDGIVDLSQQLILVDSEVVDWFAWSCANMTTKPTA
jgi:RES domain